MFWNKRADQNAKILASLAASLTLQPGIDSHKLIADFRYALSQFFPKGDDVADRFLKMMREYHNTKHDE